MLARRDVLVLAAGLVGTSVAARAGETPFSVGILEFGTVSWEIETMRRLGLDRKGGIDVTPQRLASNDAARIGFLGGSVDTIVTDLFWAARLRNEGRNLVFLPFSATEGALMVAAGSTIASIRHLAGKKLGIAGGALDKSWLLLQAQARREAGLDLASAAEPVFGAAPLLTEKLLSGELDAALLYWNFAARLEAKGYRRLIGADEIVRSFGIAAPVAFIGYAFDLDRLGARAAALPAFAAASRGAKQALASSTQAWSAIRPLMQAPDEATFEALRRRFLDGVPTRPVAEEEVDAARIYALLAEIGGERLVGAARTLPKGLYWTRAS
jgi:NitT/TauT family transport system substrate-binding protein